MVIVFNTDKFDRLETIELDGSVSGVPDLSFGNRVRAPLAVKLKGKASEKTFWFMVNHLYRSRATLRQEQATEIRKWAAPQSSPGIAGGDYNFDFRVPSGPGNTAMANFSQGDTFTWVRPAIIVKSQCSTRFNSVLDFVFVSGEAKDWVPVSTIVVRPGDCPDTSSTSDHRPVVCTFETDGDSGDDDGDDHVDDGSSLRDQILARIRHVEEELSELRDLVKRLGEE